MSYWTPWAGAEYCPVAHYFNVQVRHRNGAVSEGIAGQFCWDHHRRPFDIIAYRVQHDSVMTEEEEALPAREHHSKYHREVKPGVWVDVYDVLTAFEVTNPADAHAIKKMLVPGQRGAKDAVQDRREAIASIERAIEIYEK